MQRQLAKIDALELAINYKFSNPDLLVESLTHSSAAQELLRKTQGKAMVPWNERLEFLGDSVLGLTLSSHLMGVSDAYTEGQLSKIRAALVNEASLADLAQSLGLGEQLILGSGEEKGGGRSKTSVLADAMEALFGAIYLDSDYPKAEAVILGLYKEKLSAPLSLLADKDFKSRLQELTQSLYKEAPQYEVVEISGPEHQAMFQVCVSFRGQNLARGEGPSKKSASQDAARQALLMVGSHHERLTEGMS